MRGWTEWSARIAGWILKGLIGSTVGAVLVLLIMGFMAWIKHSIKG